MNAQVSSARTLFAAAHIEQNADKCEVFVDPAGFIKIPEVPGVVVLRHTRGAQQAVQSAWRALPVSPLTLKLRLSSPVIHDRSSRVPMLQYGLHGVLLYVLVSRENRKR